MKLKDIIAKLEYAQERIQFVEGRVKLGEAINELKAEYEKKKKKKK